MSSAFDPGGVGVRNGKFFGFPYSPEEADVVVLSAPWDVTTSFRDGTSRGPLAMLEASPQLDFTSPLRERAWLARIGTVPLNPAWNELNRRLRRDAKEIIRALESDAKVDPLILARVNEESARFHEEVERAATHWLTAGKKLVLVGGDHSVSLGAMRAQAAVGPFSILHIDAHADLRPAYEGFTHSHASVMHNALALPQVERLVQVGLRDLAPEELARTREDKRIAPFPDFDLRRNQARGATWQEQCQRVVECLSERVYLSVDIDGLDPSLCPSTGTPVPGGLALWELYFLMEEVERSGRKFIGADLVEVAPSASGEGWDANVGARILFQLCQLLT